MQRPSFDAVVVIINPHAGGGSGSRTPPRSASTIVNWPCFPSTGGAKRSMLSCSASRWPCEIPCRPSSTSELYQIGGPPARIYWSCPRTRWNYLHRRRRLPNCYHSDRYLYKHCKMSASSSFMGIPTSTPCRRKCFMRCFGRTGMCWSARLRAREKPV